MAREHHYALTLTWTGNTGEGTSGYRDYERSHTFSAQGKPDLLGSADPSFRGDAARYNPEELLVAALSACHMLWYLHLASEAGIVVEAYEDRPEGTMVEEADGGGHFTEVVLHPRVTLRPGADLHKARALHGRAHGLCYIARSVNFPVHHEATIVEA